MSRRKPLAALATVTAALAVAVPPASASAATTAPVGGPALIGFPVFQNPTCPILVGLLKQAALSGNTALANVFAIQLLYFCPNPAI